jgi:hypothetical protein
LNEKLNCAYIYGPAQSPIIASGIFTVTIALGVVDMFRLNIGKMNDPPKLGLKECIPEGTLRVFL